MRDCNNATEAARPYFLNARRIFADIAKDVKRFKPGGELMPGITSIAALWPYARPYGVCRRFGKSIVAGAGRHHQQSVAVSCAIPNGSLSSTSMGRWRSNAQTLLDLAAADRMLVQGYHFPFPAFGHITRAGTGYDLIPSVWQPTL